MEEIVKRIAGILLVAALTGCASGGMGVMDGIMDSWMGASSDDVMRQWGYPHEEKTIAGKRLLIWNRNIQMTMPQTANTSGTINKVGQTAYYSGTTTYSGGGVSNWNCTRVLELNDNNVVVNWQWEGNNCPFMEAGPYSNWRRK